jgi:hypothetical protein
MAARRRWIAAWLAGPLIGIANGAGRELLYGRRLGEQRAQQVSTAAALGLFAGYFTWLNRRWPLPDDRTALEVGSVWASLTVLFEFGFGHFVAGQSWDELLDAYDMRKGRLWPLVPLWLAAGPAVVRRVSDRKETSAGT